MSGLAAAAQRFECTNCGHDWVDYAAAVGGTLGALAAIVALVLTVRSAKDANRSADAAERTARHAEDELTLLREEAAAAKEQRAHRPRVTATITPEANPREAGAAPALIRLRLELRNTGELTAERLSVWLFVGSEVSLDEATSLSGDRLRDLDLGLGEDVHYWSEHLGPMDPHVSHYRTVQVSPPEPGDHRFVLSLRYAGYRIDEAWVLTVPAAGEDVTVQREEASAP